MHSCGVVAEEGHLNRRLHGIHQQPRWSQDDAGRLPARLADGGANIVGSMGSRAACLLLQSQDWSGGPQVQYGINGIVVQYGIGEEES